MKNAAGAISKEVFVDVQGITCYKNIYFMYILLCLIMLWFVNVIKAGKVWPLPVPDKHQISIHITWSKEKKHASDCNGLSVCWHMN